MRHDATDTNQESGESRSATATDDVRTATVGESAAKATMGEFNHTNPYTGEAFGDEMVFDRGPAVAADGGRAEGESGEDEQTMEDVDHEHPDDDAANANQVFERGKRRDDETTADEETTEGDESV